MVAVEEEDESVGVLGVSSADDIIIECRIINHEIMSECLIMISVYI